MGQFRTVWYKILCYNGRVKADGFGLSFVYELFTHSTGFLLDAEQSVLHGMLGTPRRKSLLPCPAQIAPESCRTMSHDVAQCRKTHRSIRARMKTVTHRREHKMQPSNRENHLWVAHPLAGPLRSTASQAIWLLRMMVSLLCNIGSHLYPGTNRALKRCRIMSHDVA